MLRIRSCWTCRREADSEKVRRWDAVAGGKMRGRVEGAGEAGLRGRGRLGRLCRGVFEGSDGVGAGEETRSCRCATLCQFESLRIIRRRSRDAPRVTRGSRMKGTGTPRRSSPPSPDRSTGILTYRCRVKARGRESLQAVGCRREGATKTRVGGQRGGRRRIVALECLLPTVVEPGAQVCVWVRRQHEQRRGGRDACCCVKYEVGGPRTTAVRAKGDARGSDCEASMIAVSDRLKNRGTARPSGGVRGCETRRTKATES